MSQNQRRIIDAYRARLDETAIRFDQLRRTYPECADAELSSMIQPGAGADPVEAWLRERFGVRPLPPRRSVGEVRNAIGKIRIVGGAVPRVPQVPLGVGATRVALQIRDVRVQRLMGVFVAPSSQSCSPRLAVSSAATFSVGVL